MVGEDTYLEKTTHQIIDHHILKTDPLADELTHLLEVFIQNGYPDKLVHRVLYKGTKRNEMTQQNQKEPIDFNN